ncbi:MAG: hypothetical protein ACFFD4_25745 [Candidatus Odinarchaeota archaeon]
MKVEIMENESSKTGNESKKKIADQFNGFVLELYEEALSDGAVTKEELALIKEIVLRLLEYSKTLSETFKDNPPTTEETKKLELLQAGVLRSVSVKALEDGTISPDEWKLIKKLVEYFDSQLTGIEE